jgi:hypothetical protein
VKLLDSIAHQACWRTARLGAWLIRISVARHPRGGAAVVSLVCGAEPYCGCWHRGTGGVARATALLARAEADLLEHQAVVLEEIGDMTDPK